MSIARSCVVLAMTVAIAACGAAEEELPEGFGIVGSSTVYPFAERVGQLYAEAHPDLPTPVITSGGTEAGIEEFCAGSGTETPSILNASARMTAAQFESCNANGVTDIVEIPVGLDGIVFAASSNEGLAFDMTPRIAYAALAANPFGNEQTAQNWSDIDPALPDAPIIVYGPPETSGTRVSLKDLILAPGCESNNRMAMMRDSNPERFEEVCNTLREDSSYLSQGEKDDLIVRKVAQNPRSIGIFGYSYLEESDGTVTPLTIDGVAPDAATIASGEYPAARPLFLYVKKAHLESREGLVEYLATWQRNWGAGGDLVRIGLVPLPQDRVFAGDVAAAPALTAGDLEG